MNEIETIQINIYIWWYTPSTHLFLWYKLNAEHSTTTGENFNWPTCSTENTEQRSDWLSGFAEVIWMSLLAIRNAILQSHRPLLDES